MEYTQLDRECGDNEVRVTQNRYEWSPLPCGILFAGNGGDRRLKLSTSYQQWSATRFYLVLVVIMGGF